LARGLLDLGLCPGDHVAVLMDNSIESIEVTFAAEKAALPYVPLNGRHTIGEHADILAHSDCVALIAGPEFAQTAAALMDRLPKLRHLVSLSTGTPDAVNYETLIATQDNATLPGIEIGPDHIIRFAYTSGTTGKPKGVIYSHKRWYTRLFNHFLAMEYALSPKDAMIHVGPLTHAAGVHLLPCYLRGARNIIHHSFDARHLLDDIAHHRASHIMVVPTMLERLIAELRGGYSGDLSSLRRIHYGTAPTRIETVEAALEVFGPILRQQYGMTEVIQPISVLTPEDLVNAVTAGDRDVLNSCGKPALTVDLAICDDNGDRVLPGEIGEITLAHVGGADVAYWKPGPREFETIRDGWFHTGDLGRIDDAGNLHIVGRTKDMIISGGFNVYAVEVENALASHPSVSEVAVIGLPDAEWGEKVCAAVVLNADQQVSEQDLKAHCAARIAGYKKPRVFAFLDTLPRNAVGKVVKSRLRDELLAPKPAPIERKA
jgi:acyl-CoA synthetase (AMP-forming)/AMP-acid ligase II